MGGNISVEEAILLKAASINGEFRLTEHVIADAEACDVESKRRDCASYVVGYDSGDVGADKEANIADFLVMRVY